mgnify:CR=1 FL=1|jgi:hypothetical protein
MPRPFRQEIELLQNYPKHKTFTYITPADTDAHDAVVLTGSMEECNKVSFIIEVADAYIEFDSDATTSSMLIPANEGYFDDSVWFGTKISIKAVSGQPRIRGILWGR